MDKPIAEIVKKLDGISYSDWQKLQYVMNKAFELKKRELEKSLKLSVTDEEVTRVLSE